MLLFALASLLVVLVDALAARRHELGPRGRALGALAAGGLVGLIFFLRPEAPALEKVLGRLAMPAGILFVAAWLATLRSLRRAPRRGALMLVAFLLYSAAGNHYIGSALLTRLEAPFRNVLPLAEPPFDAVFVLGGGVAPTPDLELPAGIVVTDEMKGELGGSGDRVALAARLYHAGLAPLLVASGRSVPGVGPRWESGPTTAAIWRSLGVPARAIVVLEGDYDTAMEIRSYAELARERGFERVGLVSSAWHLRRAMALAGREGFDPVPLPADRRGEPTYYGLLSLIPTGPGFDAVHRASWEWLGAALGQ